MSHDLMNRLDLIVQNTARIDQLEKALREALLQILYLHDKFGVTGSGTEVIAQINAALRDQSPDTSRANPSR